MPRTAALFLRRFQRFTIARSNGFAARCAALARHSPALRARIQRAAACTLRAAQHRTRRCALSLARCGIERGRTEAA
jgi:hypothetical protein